MSRRKNPIPTPVRGLPLPVGDAAVIAVGGEAGQLGTGRRLHPPDDEPHRRGVGLSPEGSVEPVSQSLLPSFMLCRADLFERLSAWIGWECVRDYHFASVSRRQ